MLWTSVVAFAIAALGGLTLLGLRTRQKSLPMPLALGHGFAAFIGLVCLIVAVGAGSPLFAKLALGGFLMAALGGFYLFSLHIRGMMHPVWLILGHGSLAVASFVLLLLAAIDV